MFSSLAAAFGYACTRVEPAGAPPEVAIGDAGFGGEGQGGSGSLAGEGGDGRGGTSVTVGGAPGSVELGLWPTYAPEQEQGTAAEAVLASIAALSLGSGTLPIYERWDTLSGATGEPRAMAWLLLDDLVAPYRERKRALALCIGVVDRTAPAWPVTGEVNSVAARLAMERTIDEAFARYAAQLSHLCFGYEVDRYLASVSETEGERVLELLEHAVGYARAHPLKSPRTALGVAITMMAASDAAQLDRRRLLRDGAAGVLRGAVWRARAPRRSARFRGHVRPRGSRRVDLRRRGHQLRGGRRSPCRCQVHNWPASQERLGQGGVAERAFCAFA
jgi:hypothetical protein